MTKGKNLRHNRCFHCERSCQHEYDSNIPYGQIGDCYFLNIILPRDAGDIDIWGRLHKALLRKYHFTLFSELMLIGKSTGYLVQVKHEAVERLVSLIVDMKTTQSITEEIKYRDSMAWVGAVNNICTCAQEIIYAELVYV